MNAQLLEERTVFKIAAPLRVERKRHAKGLLCNEVISVVA
jgi:hypothetical protein